MEKPLPLTSQKLWQNNIHDLSKFVQTNTVVDNKYSTDNNNTKWPSSGECRELHTFQHLFRCNNNIIFIQSSTQESQIPLGGIADTHANVPKRDAKVSVGCSSSTDWMCRRSDLHSERSGFSSEGDGHSDGDSARPQNEAEPNENQ